MHLDDVGGFDLGRQYGRVGRGDHAQAGFRGEPGRLFLGGQDGNHGVPEIALRGGILGGRHQGPGAAP